jgi:hypothetical protein
MIHSPFHIVEDFVSPLRCEALLKTLALKVPDLDGSGTPLKHERIVPSEVAGDIFSELSALEPLLERRYGAQIFGAPELSFQQFPENPKIPAIGHGAEGWKYLRKKWVKYKDVDLVGFLWLKTYHTSVPLDPRFETYGGKLEFPAYNFSLTPVQGTLVLFPATPHFVHAVSHVLVGSFEQIKICMSLRKDGVAWSYVPQNYPGTYQEWFVPN